MEYKINRGVATKVKKILSILVVCFLFASLFVPLVSASPNVPSQFITGCTSSDTVKAVQPSSSSFNSAVGQSFTSDATSYVTNVKFYLAKVGSPDGNLKAVIYALDGATTPGVDGLPSSTIIEESAVVSASTLYGTYSTITFTFMGSTQISAGSNYTVALVCDSATFDSSNYVRMAVRATNYNSTMNFNYYQSSTWFATTAYELYYIINGDTVSSGVTPTPTPTAAPTTPSTGDADMEALVAAILPWLVPLLICLIPALLAYKFVGELGFFIGLNVGVVLAKVTLEGTTYAFPLWGIILVGVMDVAVVLMRR